MLLRHYSNLLFIPFLTTLLACSESGSGGAVTSSEIDLSFSDAPVDNASEVVITVDKITFVGNGEDIVIDQFKNPDTGANDLDTFTIDLLQVQGLDSRLVVDSVELPVGEYSNMLIDILDEDTSLSYVVDAEGNKELKVPSDELKLGGFTITPLSKQSMVVEFGLAQSMTYNPGPDRYILKPRGVRIVSVDEAAALQGSIVQALLQENQSCLATDTGGTRGSAYLYPGHGLDNSLLTDNFIVEEGEDLPENIAPTASSNLEGDSYIFSYLEPGDYTLAVSCHSEDDSASAIEGFEIPNPQNQLIEIRLEAGQTLSCNLPLQAAGCGLAETES